MQIFPRSSNAIARASMVLTVLAVAGLFWAMVQVERSRMPECERRSLSRLATSTM
jgi:hypothetical protein